MSTQHQDPSEHDPAISALYRQAGDLEPPASLDEAVLATARRATRQRRQRWLLPLSTAAVIMLSVTVLLQLNNEWQFSQEMKDSAPSSLSGYSTADKSEPLLSHAQQKLARERASANAKPAEAPAQQPASIPPPPARAKKESTDALAISEDFSSLSDATIQEAEKTMGGATASSPKSEKEIMKQADSPVALKMVPAEQEVPEPKAWLEKIRKLVEAKKMDDARKELKAFKKRYPDHKLPDDLKSL